MINLQVYNMSPHLLIVAQKAISKQCGYRATIKD
jgi:hypothetical protein